MGGAAAAPANADGALDAQEIYSFRKVLWLDLKGEDLRDEKKLSSAEDKVQVFV